MGETALAALLCGFLGGGETEVRHYFSAVGETRHVRIDCETSDHVIEIGLDNKASARDSLHQALFSSYLTGKTPMVVIIDTDAREDRYQHELRITAGMANVAFGVCSEGFILRWAATSPYRTIGVDKSLNDLPRGASYTRYCDLTESFDAPE